MRKWLLNLSGFVLMLLVCGTEHAVACASGFAIQADERVTSTQYGTVANIPAAYQGLRGEWDWDLSGAEGSGYGFQATADSTGYLNVSYARAPAVWDLGETNGVCVGQWLRNVSIPAKGVIVYVYCDIHDDDFSANPNSWYFDEARDVTVTGSGISLSAITYVVSPLGNVYRTVYGADSDTSIYIPSLQLSPGGWDYYLVVTNPYGDGTYIAIGMVILYIQCTDVCSN